MEFSVALKVKKKTLFPIGWKNTVTRTDDAAMTFVSLKEAMLFCWWFSKQQGIPDDQQCYVFDGEFFDDSPEICTVENYLLKSGYRIPTEAEWEFACRAGASTSRYYGLTENLLPNYAWYQANGNNRSWPVASLKPNDFGLFDMQGNVFEWVYDTHSGSPTSLLAAAKDAPKTAAVSETVSRVLRGGSFGDLALLVRSAFGAAGGQPGFRDGFNGFRPARTYNLSP